MTPDAYPLIWAGTGCTALLLGLIAMHRIQDRPHVAHLHAKGRLTKRRRLAIDALGWYGMAAVLSSYLLLTFELAKPATTIYQGLILTGSVALSVNTYAKRAYPSTWLNVIFSLIAVASLLRIWL